MSKLIQKNDVYDEIRGAEGNVVQLKTIIIIDQCTSDFQGAMLFLHIKYGAGNSAVNIVQQPMSWAVGQKILPRMILVSTPWECISNKLMRSMKLA